jgi:hypothetical protein
MPAVRADGASVFGVSARYPSYATVTASGHSQEVWPKKNEDGRAL